MSDLKKMKKISRAQQKAVEVAEAYVSKEQINADPNGSWTGKPRNANEVPVQDADDL